MKWEPPDKEADCRHDSVSGRIGYDTVTCLSCGKELTGEERKETERPPNSEEWK